MDELHNIFSLGFSGSDLWRALWIGLLASLLATRRFRPWKVGILAFFFDRAWPYYMMWTSGYEGDVISAAVVAAVQAIPLDIAYYMVRYLGILGLVYFGFNLRIFIHAKPPTPAKHRNNNVYPY